MKTLQQWFSYLQIIGLADVSAFLQLSESVLFVLIANKNLLKCSTFLLMHRPFPCKWSPVCGLSVRNTIQC